MLKYCDTLRAVVVFIVVVLCKNLTVVHNWRKQQNQVQHSPVDVLF